MGLKSIQTVVSHIVRAEKAVSSQQSDRLAFELFQKITSGYGRDLSEVTYKGKNLEQLPEFVQKMTTGLRKPSVVANGRSLKNGQGIFGFAVRDGNKTIATSSLGIDLTRGEPIFQIRGSYGNGSERAISFNGTFNSNLTGESAFWGDIFVNKELAKTLGVPEAALNAISAGKSAALKGINNFLESTKALFGNKGSLVYSIDECMPTLVEIASQTGKVTKKSAKKAVEKVLKQMGQNPKNIKLKFIGKEETSIFGYFDMITGELNLNLNLLKNHQDLADIIAHELTHMEDFIMLYKQIGPKEFKRLVGVNKSGKNIEGVLFNQKWYDKMSRYIIDKHFAFEWEGKTTKITLHDGTEITDPKSIKEFLATNPDPPRFNITRIKEELKLRKKYGKQNSDGNYARFKYQDYYINSDVEKHARNTEMQLKHKLQEAGVYRKTSLSEGYAKASQMRYEKEFSESFRRINRALTKQGKDVDKEFNQLYEKAFKELDSELAEIDKKLAGGLPKEEFEVLTAKRDTIFKERYGTLENLDLQIMEVMQKNLGLPKIPSFSDFSLMAMEKLNPQIADMDRKLRAGLQKEEFKKLKDKQLELIKQEFGSEEVFSLKVSGLMNQLRKEFLEKN